MQQGKKRSRSAGGSRPVFDAALGLAAAAFAWGLTLAYNAFAPVLALDGTPAPTLGTPGR
jgi:hypothetical protein